MLGGINLSDGQVAGALVVPVLHVDWVRKGDLFFSFRSWFGVHCAWERGGVGLTRSLEEFPIHLFEGTCRSLL